MTEAKTTNWNQLLAQLQARDGNRPNSDTFNIPNFRAMLSKGGGQIKYGGRLLVYDPQKKEWNAFERDGPSRWESTNIVEKDEKVLEEYRTALEEYAHS